MSGKFLLIYICNFHVLNDLLLIYICKLRWNQILPRSREEAQRIGGAGEFPTDLSTALLTALSLAVQAMSYVLERVEGMTVVRAHSREQLERDTFDAYGKVHFLIYICNFHVLNHFLLIYIWKLHWNLNMMFVCQVNYF
jgi:hypothetical protein